MQRGSMTDREAYPTAWITLAVLVLLYLLWRFALGAPTVSRCWPMVLVGLFLANCVVRNVLWLGLGVPL